MKRYIFSTILPLIIVLPILAIQDHPTNSITDTMEISSIVLCGNCGELKGTDVCCATDAIVCGCGAHKGSPACCKIELSGQDVTLCNNCGQVKGTDICCAKNAAKCDNCGKTKGSPGCCLGVVENEPNREKHE
ncbi:MAG: hypothetical protein HOC41_08255 [Candidatus Marinimicrobia bacterium]|jgi:hypothetical protein|nr:hypothetical protein [Candidatus Neomarinimicrobiota bacterium]MBT3946067.1 hypothetical protein [Candidatus Neomarinimicrobiota bacterium]MBT4155024.1 hypothetical protein [Candidatus Neomarinimicrobiota bacterium]MBT4555659.1 hypothetical protein [Candidatus Neomarinimicrobiota bacterium]MBT4752728.1 hypothetical protein [Candidatus Neomarinimicrobiota bacterium]